MRFGWNSKQASIRVEWLATIVALLFTIIYTLIYRAEPFPAIWNTIFTDLSFVAASLFVAIFATMIWARFDKSDSPRRVWSQFAIALWLWVIAEVVWGYLNVTQGEVQEGPADIFWVIAYFFLGQALFSQYQIIVRPSAREFWSRVAIFLLSLLAIFLLIYGILSPNSEATNQLGTVVNSFYPAADFLLALVALWFSRNFRGGIFSRPWLGLLAFAFADLFYAWLEISGLYSWSVNEANLLSTVADIAYLVAYLILGLGVFSQWVFLKYGFRSSAEAR